MSNLMGFSLTPHLRIDKVLGEMNNRTSNKKGVREEPKEGERKIQRREKKKHREKEERKIQRGEKNKKKRREVEARLRRLNLQWPRNSFKSNII